MVKQALVDRLANADPGWPIWAELIALVNSLDFQRVTLEYVGEFIASDTRLSFGVRDATPDFAPAYVAALFGMKCDEPEMAGRFADAFYGGLAQRGSLFGPAGNDAAMGYPEFDPPPETYPFQSNSSGAVVFINRDLEIIVPNAGSESFDVLNSLDSFTQQCIQSALDNQNWFSAYVDRCGDLLD